MHIARLQHSVDNLLDINKELEWNNQLLQEEINKLQTNSALSQPDKRDELIAMMAPDILRNGVLKGRDQYIYDIYNLYCEIYGKEGEAHCQQSEKS